MADISFVLALVAAGVAAKWTSSPERIGVPFGHHGEVYGKGLISGQLLVGDDPQHAEPVSTGSVAFGNIYQVGPVAPSVVVWSDGGFSAYAEPGTYSVFGVSPEYHDGAAACEPYGRPNGTITVRAGDRIAVALLCSVSRPRRQMLGDLGKALKRR
jgi:hypothetical protein